MVTVIPFQQQEGTSDCGLFSIAAAYHPAKNDDLSHMSFNQLEMRKHLQQFFEKNQLTAFPTGNRDVTRNPRRHVFVHVYCTCGMPESYDSRMVECEACELWFHFKCVGLKRTAPDTWLCKDCRRK